MKNTLTGNLKNIRFNEREKFKIIMIENKKNILNNNKLLIAKLKEEYNFRKESY